MVYRWLFPFLWLVFIAVWIAMARSGKAVAERESVYSRLSHYLPLAIAIYLLAAPHVPIAPLNDRFAPLSLWLVRVGAALTFAGIAFAIWARIRLAGNWSSDVTLKRDHELIVDGPYGSATRSTPAFSSPSSEPRWRSGSGAACSPSSSRARRIGASCGSRRPSCAGSSAGFIHATRSACRRSFHSCFEAPLRRLP